MLLHTYSLCNFILLITVKQTSSLSRKLRRPIGNIRRSKDKDVLCAEVHSPSKCLDSCLIITCVTIVVTYITMVTSCIIITCVTMVTGCIINTHVIMVLNSIIITYQFRYIMMTDVISYY